MTLSGKANSPVIAVGPIKTYGVFATPKMASKLARLELIKLEKYNVLDEFDMNEIPEPEKYNDCFGKDCLLEYGKELGADLILSGNVDALGNKIVISFKIIDVNGGEIKITGTRDFDNQEAELQRMMRILLQEMHGITPEEELAKRLEFKNEPITSNNVGQINNSGPRMGMSYTVGTLNEFLTRPESQGGMEIAPVVSNLGYQFEIQYVGTENFSALFEFVPLVSGLEQGKFIPSISILNGFRFGQSGWEFAFGPSFGLSKTSTGFFDTEAKYGEEDRYWSRTEFINEGFSTTEIGEHGYDWSTHGDTRGTTSLSTRWVMAFGRTFKSGSLNVPVNLFFSSLKGGGMAGFSVGFNIVRKKKNIN